MKRVFLIAIALVIILSLPYTFLAAQESREGSAEARERDRRPAEVERDRDERHAEAERDADPPYHPEERERKEHDMMEMMFHRMFEMIEHQMHEIHALREEIAELREMLMQRPGMRWQRQRRGWMPEREMDRRPPRERWEPERRDPDIERHIREIEAEVERHPEDIELRMKLGHLYREVDRIEAAVDQYKAALEIDPAFDPPFHALEELGHRFPEMEREKEEPLEDSIGEVISANEKEIQVKTREGEAVTFKVPYRKKEDGSWVLNDDFSEFAKSLEPGVQLKILWREAEGQRIIHRVEKVEKMED